VDSVASASICAANQISRAISCLPKVVVPALKVSVARVKGVICGLLAYRAVRIARNSGGQRYSLCLDTTGATVARSLCFPNSAASR